MLSEYHAVQNIWHIVRRYVERHQLLHRKYLRLMKFKESGGTAANGYHHTHQTIM